MTNSESRLTINLGAVRRNWRRLQGQLRPGCQCAAVTKANAYGLGAAHVAPALFSEGCREFFVATVTEGVELRQLLPEEAIIYVLNGLRPGREDICLEYRLIPVIFTREQMQRWSDASDEAGLRLPCALKFNSGMTRLGLDWEDLQELCSNDKLLRRLQPVLFASHLACADEPEHPMNLGQLEAFRRGLTLIRTVVPSIRASLSNSSGVFLGDDWHFDVARPGASLYGVNPVPGSPSPVEPVVSLQLPIVQLREVNGGEQVGYGATYQVAESGRLAVALGGYADGLHRTLGNRGRGMLCGVEVPLVGRVSMDSVCFDISSVPPEKLPPEGQAYIDLLGATLTVDHLAEAAGTIGYEVLTSLGDRYDRRYVDLPAEDFFATVSEGSL